MTVPLNISKLLQKVNFNSSYYYSALAFAFTLPLSRAAVSFFIFWFIFLFLFEGQFKQAWEQVKSSSALKAIALFIGFLSTSILWSDNAAEALQQIRLYSYWIIIPILAIRLQKQWIVNLVTAFLLGMLVSEIIAYGIYFELWTFNDRTPDYPSPFMSHIHYSIFLATTAIILLNRLLTNRYSLRTKLPILLFFITSTGNLFISTGRTGQLAFIIALAVAVVIHFRLTIKSLLIFFLLSTTLLVGTYTSLPIFQKRIDRAIFDIKQMHEGNLDTSWGLRVAFGIITYDILKEHPLIGVGIGDYSQAAAEVLAEVDHGFSQFTKNWCASYHFHNQYLMILAQVGLIGFSLMLWIFYNLLRLTIDDSEIKELSALGLTVYIVAAFAEPLWILQFPIILFVFITSISIAAGKSSIVKRGESVSF